MLTDLLRRPLSLLAKLLPQTLRRRTFGGLSEPDPDGGLQIRLTVEQLVLVASLFFALSANRLFLGAALQGREASSASTWGFAVAILVALVAVHALLVGLVANRWTVKPLLAVLIVGTAFASHFMQTFHVYLDPSMLRNVMRTDVGEARELLSLAMLVHLLIHAVLPLLVLSRVRIVTRPSWLRSTLVRLGMLLLTLGVLVGAILAIFQPFSSLMRNQKEMRFLITPANYLWSIGSVVAQDLRGARKPRAVIGEDAKPGPGWASQTRPRLLVLVVGETARAANWGLNGYARQTTPELAKLPVINFPDVTSCGTNTEVSLPCMFAPVGRRDYDEDRIRGSQSLLHVLSRAGVGVLWRDNQSGCKGVCEGLPSEEVAARPVAGLCEGGRCFDEALLDGFDARLDRIAAGAGRELLVLHQLGNHGPSYFRRYPPAFDRFQPACQSDDLQKCSPQEIVNAYDNALLYTDHVVATLIGKLQARADRIDAAVLYVSDHGESLGENNLFLHGLPYSIAPDLQKKVPMVMWLSDGLQRSTGLDLACAKAVAARPVRHDHLFHTVLGLFDVQTTLHEREWDLLAACMPPAGKP
ncbi:phosphoethanolamine transferase [Leptothrix discophora]|uniref:Phosphoethanolamine--lipid A transferase n=1 Tax=Leptothrix discophora TaxID=89 RepID=A0ABT9FZB1_LEPDI|nr:phosphoethanolamine--lipid A transferase [Leptothrix discophora]MDP4299571.1 phosphoethanolamine--lipid A transferase [Leptothrix discophora]